MRKDSSTQTDIGEAYVNGFLTAYLSNVGDTGDGWINYDRSTPAAFVRSVLDDMLISLEDADLRDEAVREAEKIEVRIRVDADMPADLRKCLWANYSARCEYTGVHGDDGWTIHVKMGYVDNVRETLTGLNIPHE